MRQADPSIKIGAIGGLNQGRYAIVNYDDWNKIVLEQAGDQIDFLAVHNAYAPLVARDYDKDVRTVYQAMLAAPVLIARNLDAISKQIERHAPDRAGEIGIAVTEWGPAFMFDPRNRYVDHVKTLGSALFAASTLKTFIESPRTEIANFFLLNDMSVLGWIGSRNGEFPPKPDWAATARYYAFQLFTRHFGDQLVTSTVEGPMYDSAAIGLVDAVKDVPYLDIVSSLSTDGETLYIIAVNKHFEAPIEASISLGGFVPTGRGAAWTLTGKAIDAHTGTTPLQIPGFGWAKQAAAEKNSRFHRGGPDEISLSSAPVEGVAAEFTYSFPPHSVTSLILERGASGK
jgi:alpha-N-arabinofuranosidase